MSALIWLASPPWHATDYERELGVLCAALGLDEPPLRFDTVAKAATMLVR